ncbi:MAG: zinc-binding dehydrogenase [Planctomycetes bacterium]|nr:zinc-binding dehydrogenase [Planctomycetota bacterium]
MKAKIAFMYGPHDLRIEETELPPLKPNELLIKVGACGICQSDVECYEGHSAEGRYDIAPFTPGHEWSGQVVELGSDVKDFAVGDKVTGDCVIPCGYCQNCKEGKMPSACLNMRELGFMPNSPGAMGEYLILERDFTHKFPSDWSYFMGTWIENFSVGYWGIWGNGGYVDASDDVVIIGGGPIGISATITADVSGANIIMVDPLESRRERAKKYGANYALDPTKGDIAKMVREVTDGRGASVVVECSGNDIGIASLFDIAGHSARVGLVGHSIGRKVPAELGKVIWSNLRIVGSGGTKNFLERTIRFLSRIKDNYDFDALNSHYLPFEDVHKGLEIASKEKQTAFKVMLTYKGMTDK